MQSESVLDSPREGLDPIVWSPDEDGSYVLSPEARVKVRNVVAWILRNTGIREFRANLTGSIASNQWKEDSDIDIHVGSPEITEENKDELNRELRKRFEEFAASDPDAAKIGNHPIEVYLQANPYQDMMSVGCYDIVDDKWLSGPQIVDVDYDPVSDYWDEDMDLVGDVVKDSWKIVRKAWENATAWKMSKDPEFRGERFEEVVEQLEKAKKTYDDLRAFRTSQSSPESEEEAKMFRTSREWKVAESAFKLLDKLGYLRTFKAFSKCLDSLEEGVSEEGVVETVLQVAKNVFETGISEGVLENIDEETALGEGLGKYLTIAGLAGLLSIPTVLGSQKIEKNLGKIPPASMRIDSPKVQNAIAAAAKPARKEGGLLPFQVINLVARTLYNEARGEGDEGLKAVLTVIYNRTGGDPQFAKDVISEYWQFSCWNGYNWKNLTYTIPKGIVTNAEGNLPIWKRCLQLAAEYQNGTFEPLNREWNSYMNKATADPVNVKTWGKMLKKRVGKHHFGYLREHDPKYVIPGTTTPRPRVRKTNQTSYVVKSGDTLSGIAKALGVGVSDLIEKNRELKENPNRLKIGQKLNV